MGTNEDDSNNVCDCYLPDICQIWNNAFQVKGECNLTCQNNSRSLILKDSKGLHICSANNECTLQTYKGKDSENTYAPIPLYRTQILFKGSSFEKLILKF